MRIMICASDNNSSSGAFLCMVKLAAHLKEFGHEVRIIIPHEGDGTKLLIENNLDWQLVETHDWVMPKGFWKIKSKVKPIFRFYFKKTSDVEAATKAIKEFNPDIVHINTSWCYAFGCAAENLRIPIIWQIQELIEEGQRMRFINKRFAKTTLAKATYVVAISKTVYDKYLSLGLKNLQVIFDGLDINYYRSAYHVIFSKKELVFLLLGGVQKNKGQVEVCEWLGRCWAEKVLPEDFQIRIVGPYTPKVRQIIEKKAIKQHINQKILFTGKQKDVRPEYRKADILVVNSTYEAFGRVTVEGLLSGLCVMASNKAGSAEIIEDGRNGFLYSQNSYEDFSRVLKNILTNKTEISNMLKTVPEIMANKFSSERNAREFERLYLSCIKR